MRGEEGASEGGCEKRKRAEQLGVFSFFFQAEDGIRDYDVTGVQTCALPILIATAAMNNKIQAGQVKISP